MCFKRDKARASDGHIGASIAQNDLFTIEWVQDNGHSITPQNSQVQAAKVDTAAFKLESRAGTCWMDYAVARYLMMLLTKRRAGTACGLVMMLRLPKKFSTKKHHRKIEDNHGMVST